jgi:organic radical activating enzyme
MSDRLKTTQNKLHQVSSCFCVAKWSHATIHLHSGMGHSCHHPMLHAIPSENLLQYPHLLHNTEIKMQARKEMLAGQRPEECVHCWTYEDANTENFSDRVIKSSSPWAAGELEKISQDPLNQKFMPRYLEVSFSRLCNLKCVYCGPHFSSAWAQEQALHTGNENEFAEEKENIYTQSFWKWWPELKPNLRVLRLTGGEPLLHSAVHSLLEDILDGDPVPFQLLMNSNLSVPEKYSTKTLDVLQRIYHQKKAPKIKIISSMESVGASARYIRHGIQEGLFWKNILNIRKLDFCDLSITATLNTLAIGNLREFYYAVAEIKKQTEGAVHQFFIDPTLLKSPSHLNILKFPDREKKIFIHECDEILKDTEKYKLSKYEILRLQIVQKVVLSKLGQSVREDTERLYDYLTELDLRRNLDFRRDFNALTDLWKEVESWKESLNVASP